MITWTFNRHLEDRQNLAIHCLVLALQRSKATVAERFKKHAARYWREMNDEFNSEYSAWAD